MLIILTKTDDADLVYDDILSEDDLQNQPNTTTNNKNKQKQTKKSIRTKFWRQMKVLQQEPNKDKRWLRKVDRLRKWQRKMLGKARNSVPAAKAHNQNTTTAPKSRKNEIKDARTANVAAAGGQYFRGQGNNLSRRQRQRQTSPLSHRSVFFTEHAFERFGYFL